MNLKNYNVLTCTNGVTSEVMNETSAQISTMIGVQFSAKKMIQGPFNLKLTDINQPPKKQIILELQGVEKTKDLETRGEQSKRDLATESLLTYKLCLLIATH